jgi:hypothetical protein
MTEARVAAATQEAAKAPRLVAVVKREADIPPARIGLSRGAPAKLTAIVGGVTLNDLSPRNAQLFRVGA